MRVVFDTNVLVSAIIKPGGLPDIALTITRHGTVAQSVTSWSILVELHRVLSTKIRTNPVDIEIFMRVLKQHSEIISPQRVLHVVRDDPSDNRILECALEGKADIIVSGDRHLLALGKFRKILILTVREFVDIMHR